MGDQFSVRVQVRSYEVDSNDHLNHANYHRYGEHARTEHLRAAGCSLVRLNEQRMGVVLLETHVRFLHELRYGDEVEVGSRLSFGEGKTFGFEHTLRRLGGGSAGDDVIAAEITCRMGLLDHNTRRLLAGPRTRLVELATAPELLG